MKCLIIQPGAFGDICICAPIAKYYYDLGYQVDWPVTGKFMSTLKRFWYVNPIALTDEELDPDWLRSDVMKILPMAKDYDLVLNLADRGPHPTAQLPGENFEQAKYRIAKVPFSLKNQLLWRRDEWKEDQLFNLMNPKNEKYSIAHVTDSFSNKTELNVDGKVIFIEPVENFEIFDWHKLLYYSENIYCIESSIHQFVDGIVHRFSKRPKLLRRQGIPDGGRYTVSEFWDKSIFGENTRVIG